MIHVEVVSVESEQPSTWKESEKVERAVLKIHIIVCPPLENKQATLVLEDIRQRNLRDQPL